VTGSRPAEREPGQRSWWVLAPAAVVVASVTGALTQPTETAAALAGGGLLLASIRWPRAVSLGFMLAGPLFLSGFTAGPMTLDNVAVLYGAAVALGWLLTGPRRGTPLAAWPTAVAAAVAATALVNGGAGAPGLARFLSLAVLALVLANSGPDLRGRTATAVEIAVTLGAIVMITQPFTGFPDAYGTAEGVGQRFGGLFGHPNFAAYTISLVLLYQLYAKRFSTARIGSTGILLLALVLTGSRAALLVFVVLMLPALWMRAKRFFGLLLPAVAALPFVGTTILTRLESITATGGLSGQNASGWRLGQWRQALEATRGYEFLGIGWGRSADFLGDHLGAHSTYVQILLELGRVGAVICAVGAVVLLRAARSVRIAQLLLAYVVITSISDPVLLYPSCLTVLLVLLAPLLERDGTTTATAPDDAADAAPAGGAPPPLTPSRQLVEASR
jgi:O-Antigen ligase